MPKQTLNTFLTQPHSHTWTKSFWEGKVFLNIYNFYKGLIFQKVLASKKPLKWLYEILYYSLIIWMILLWMHFNPIGYKFCASQLHRCLFEAFTATPRSNAFVLYILLKNYLLYAKKPPITICCLTKDPKIINSGMNSANVAAFRHHWLVAHLLFPYRLPSVTASLWNVFFLCHTLWFLFNQGETISRSSYS